MTSSASPSSERIGCGFALKKGYHRIASFTVANLPLISLINSVVKFHCPTDVENNPFISIKVVISKRRSVRDKTEGDDGL